MFRIKQFLPILIPLVFTLAISYYLQYEVLKSKDQFAGWLGSFGPYVIVIYFFLQGVTIVFAPIGGFFLIVALIALFGAETALVLAYFATTPYYLVNFYLSRRFGRPLVKKVIGHQAVEKVDHLVKDAGLAILIMTRILQSGNFDYLSYGWGLTKIPFRTFLIVNILAGVPGLYITYLIITRFDKLVFGVLAFYATSTVLAVVAIYLTHILKRHTKV